MAEVPFIQYGSLGIVAVVVYFFVQIMRKLVDATIKDMGQIAEAHNTGMNKLLEAHEKSTKEVISEIRENSIALSQRLNDVQLGIVQSLSGGASRPPMGSRPR